MTQDLRKRIEKVIEVSVRPQMGEHQGDIEIVEIKDDILKVRFLGRCSNCPAANMTLESLVCSAIAEEIPEIKDVILVSGVSEDLLSVAKDMLKQRDAVRNSTAITTEEK
ncbi:MAG: NifU family protein [Lachnospiraceae bacterium]|nr:NifU family protein [Lachnospiraceae bacterium]